MLWHEEEKLDPMPPPPAPQAPPDVRLVHAAHATKANTDLDDDDDELLTPQSPPIPHTHPLLTLSDESTRNLKLHQEKGGMAMSSSEQLRRHWSIATHNRQKSTI